MNARPPGRPWRRLGLAALTLTAPAISVTLILLLARGGGHAGVERLQIAAEQLAQGALFRLGGWGVPVHGAEALLCGGRFHGLDAGREPGALAGASDHEG